MWVCDAATRSRLWLERSSALQLQEQAGSGAFSALLGRARADYSTDPAWRAVADQIELDVGRTFGREVAEEELDALRSVLLAYAMRNTAVRYAQGMNMLAMTLLRQVKQCELAFWTLAGFMETVAPLDYYDAQLSGVQADMSVFERLLPHFQPELAAHVARHEGMDVTWFMCSWLMTLLEGDVPAASQPFVWDAVFAYGQARALFAVCLAFLETVSDALLRVTDPCEANEMLMVALSEWRSRECSPQVLVNGVLRYVPRLDQNLIQELRQDHADAQDPPRADLSTESVAAYRRCEHAVLLVQAALVRVPRLSPAVGPARAAAWASCKAVCDVIAATVGSRGQYWPDSDVLQLHDSDASTAIGLLGGHVRAQRLQLEQAAGADGGCAEVRNALIACTEAFRVLQASMPWGARAERLLLGRPGDQEPREARCGSAQRAAVEGSLLLRKLAGELAPVDAATAERLEAARVALDKALSQHMPARVWHGFQAALAESARGWAAEEPLSFLDAREGDDVLVAAYSVVLEAWSLSQQTPGAGASSALLQALAEQLDAVVSQRRARDREAALLRRLISALERVADARDARAPAAATLSELALIRQQCGWLQDAQWRQALEEMAAGYERDLSGQSSRS